MLEEEGVEVRALVGALEACEIAWPLTSVFVAGLESVTFGDKLVILGLVRLNEMPSRVTTSSPVFTRAPFESTLISIV